MTQYIPFNEQDYTESFSIFRNALEYLVAQTEGKSITINTQAGRDYVQSAWDNNTAFNVLISDESLTLSIGSNDSPYPPEWGVSYRVVEETPTLSEILAKVLDHTAGADDA